MDPLRWGILSTGKIAQRLAKSIRTSSTGTLQAVSSRDPGKAQSFAEEFGAIRAHENHMALLADPEVDAVYIATPHPYHAEWAIQAARAGKHILCEKPAAMTLAEAESIIDAARECRVFFMEAFMYRCHPQTELLVRLIRDGAIGDVGLIQCSFGFEAPYDRAHRLFARSAGGGGILDVGCYCASMARLIAGAAGGGDFAEPTELKAMGHIDPLEGGDLLAAAVLKFPHGIVAQISTGLRLQQENVVRVLGSKGIMTINQPWTAGRKGATIAIQRHEKNETETIATETDDDLYHYELDIAARHREEGQAPSPAMTWADTLGNMRTLDMWRREIGQTDCHE